MLLVPHTRTVMAQFRSFASNGLSPLNALSLSALLFVLLFPLSLSKPISSYGSWALAALLSGSNALVEIPILFYSRIYVRRHSQ